MYICPTAQTHWQSSRSVYLTFQSRKVLDFNDKCKWSMMFCRPIGKSIIESLGDRSSMWCLFNDYKLRPMFGTANTPATINRNFDLIQFFRPSQCWFIHQLVINISINGIPCWGWVAKCFTRCSLIWPIGLLLKNSIFEMDILSWGSQKVPWLGIRIQYKR